MTMGFSKIMIDIDGSKESVNAADYAIAIANRLNAELIAVNILTSDIGYAYSSPGVESPPLTVREIILLAEDEAKNWFNKINEKVDESGIRFRRVHCGQEIHDKRNVGLCRRTKYQFDCSGYR
jgi:nucleotide-binding universal stress UspA family protein